MTARVNPFWLADDAGKAISRPWVERQGSLL